MHLKMSSAKWRPFCLGLNVLIIKPVYCRKCFVVYATRATWRRTRGSCPLLLEYIGCAEIKTYQHHEMERINFVSKLWWTDGDPAIRPDIESGTHYMSVMHGGWNHQQLGCLLNSLLGLITKKASRLDITGPLWSTSDRWLHLTKGQWCGKPFHVMTSSCVCSFTISNHFTSWIFLRKREYIQISCNPTIPIRLRASIH